MALESDSGVLEEPLLPLSEIDADGRVTIGPSNDRDDEVTAEADCPPPSLAGLIFLRALYFFNGLSASTWGRFGIIYYNDVQHLSEAQIGILQGVQSAIGFVAQPLWGRVADQIHSRKRVYLFNKLVSSAFLLSLAVVDNSFIRILGIVVGMSVFRASGVLDAYTIDFLGEAHRDMYGTVRLWTAVSWGLGALVMGYLTESLGFSVNFYLYAGMSLVMWCLILVVLPARSKTEQRLYIEHHLEEVEEETRTQELTEQPQNLHHGPRPDILWKALFRWPVLFWLIEVAIIGGAMSIVDTFLFVYLQNDLDASTVLCGWSVCVTVTFELPIFQFSKYLLSTVGHDYLMLGSLLAYMVRAIGYSLLTEATVHYVLLLEVSHGITFACMWIASVDFAAAVAPPEWATTVQTILGAVLSCLGGGGGPVLGGWVAHSFGFPMLWRAAAVVVAVVSLCHGVVLWLGFGHENFLRRLGNERQDTDEQRSTGASGVDLYESGSDAASSPLLLAESLINEDGSSEPTRA